MPTEAKHFATNMKKYIEVNLQWEALHRWPDADKLPDVSFLKHPHRHIFHIRVRVQVQDSNREIEIILFKRKIEDWLYATYQHDFETRSCEQIAEEILTEFAADEVQVMEDGENGAVLTK